MISLRQKPPGREAQPSYRSNCRKINFRHPAYSGAAYANIILTLDARDSAEHGLHVGTAHTACAILACNRPGYFTATRHGLPLDFGIDDLLTGRDYYYHVKTRSEADDGISPQDAPNIINYAVALTFSDWPFPHDGELAELWPIDGQDEDEDEEENDDEDIIPTPSAVTAAVISRDTSCIVSEERDEAGRAHLCPSSEWTWFSENGMEHYNTNKQLSGRKATDDIANSVTMRRDIHQAFDNRTFIITRKSNEWAAHFLKATHEKGRQYHNTKVKIGNGISSAFLLARFAWAIFPLVNNFFNKKDARFVRYRAESSHTWTTELLQPDKLSSYIGAYGNSRTSSPTKRLRSDTGVQDVDDPGPKRRRLYVPDEQSHSSSDSSYLKTLRSRALEQQRHSQNVDTCCTGKGVLCLECAGAEYQDLPSLSVASEENEDLSPSIDVVDDCLERVSYEQQPLSPYVRLSQTLRLPDGRKQAGSDLVNSWLDDIA